MIRGAAHLYSPSSKNARCFPLHCRARNESNSRQGSFRTFADTYLGVFGAILRCSARGGRHLLCLWLWLVYFPFGATFGDCILRSSYIRQLVQYITMTRQRVKIVPINRPFFVQLPRDLCKKGIGQQTPCTCKEKKSVSVGRVCVLSKPWLELLADRFLLLRC